MKKLLSLLIVIFVLSGCGQDQSFEPVNVNPEIDVCEICNMSIAAENFAAEAITTQGDVYKFDDISCMVEFLQGKIGVAVEDLAKRYVRDVNTGEWIELEQAYHAYHDDFWTPMANGVVTFKSKEDAEHYIKEEGKGVLYDYNSLAGHQWSWSR